MIRPATLPRHGYHFRLLFNGDMTLPRTDTPRPFAFSIGSINVSQCPLLSSVERMA
jgi:hypothetical protein